MAGLSPPAENWTRDPADPFHSEEFLHINASVQSNLTLFRAFNAVGPF